MAIQNVKIQNVTLQNVTIQNVKIQTVKTQNTKCDNTDHGLDLAKLAGELGRAGARVLVDPVDAGAAVLAHVVRAVVDVGRAVLAGKTHWAAARVVGVVVVARAAVLARVACTDRQSFDVAWLRIGLLCLRGAETIDSPAGSWEGGGDETTALVKSLQPCHALLRKGWLKGKLPLCKLCLPQKESLRSVSVNYRPAIFARSKVLKYHLWRISPFSWLFRRDSSLDFTLPSWLPHSLGRIAYFKVLLSISYFKTLKISYFKT